MNEIINAELVSKISEIAEQWTVADRPFNPATLDNSIRKGMAHWAVRSIRAGIERGAMVEIGKITPTVVIDALELSEDDPLEIIGETVYQAYKSGCIISAMDMVR